jgi:hypothetical protein
MPALGCSSVLPFRHLIVGLTNHLKVTGVARNRIVARAKRIGGGFGGKETRATHVLFFVLRIFTLLL